MPSRKTTARAQQLSSSTLTCTRPQAMTKAQAARKRTKGMTMTRVSMPMKQQPPRRTPTTTLLSLACSASERRRSPRSTPLSATRKSCTHPWNLPYSRIACPLPLRPSRCRIVPSPVPSPTPSVTRSALPVLQSPSRRIQAAWLPVRLTRRFLCSPHQPLRRMSLLLNSELSRISRFAV